MIHDITGIAFNEATHHQLTDNAARCARRNIRVHVNSINADRSVALCSVEQLRGGFFQRNCSVQELIWRAEQALAPLIGLGILPMITVKHQDLKNASEATAPRNVRSLMDRLRDLAGLLGLPFAREGFSPLPVAGDPFGWRRAMTTTQLP